RNRHSLLLAVAGGGTSCRARLCTLSGATLGEGSAGAANIRFGVEHSFAAILEATMQCVVQAKLSTRDLSRMTACLALAGACEPTAFAAAQKHEHPFQKANITTDAHAAGIGAHGGRDGGVIGGGRGSLRWAGVT